MNWRRALALGVGIGISYVAVLSATMAWSGHDVRPLFDGAGPAPLYQWVNPPPEYAAGNTPPTPFDAVIPRRKTGGFDAIGVVTPDSQFAVSVTGGAIPDHADDNQVAIHVEPLDPAKYAPLPQGLRSDGNAYAVTLAYRPSGAPVTLVEPPGDLGMRVPVPGTAIYFSIDGHAWQLLEVQNLGNASAVGAPFDRPGIYVVGTALPENAGADGSMKWPAVAVLGATVALAAAFVIGPMLLQRPVRSGGATRTFELRRDHRTRTK